VDLRVFHGGPGTEQLQLALEQIVLADLAHLEAALVQRVECVVHCDVRRRVAQRHLRGVQVEERARNGAGNILACLVVRALGHRRAE
jgi:hypothetical protein